MIERGDSCAAGVDPLGRLCQLSWITHEHDISSSRADGERVRQRILSGLVNNEEVQRLIELLA